MTANVEPTEVLTIDEAVRRFRAALLDWKTKVTSRVAAENAMVTARKLAEDAHCVMEEAEGNLIRTARMQEPPIEWPDWSRHIDG